MPLTPSEKQKRYRDRLRGAGVTESVTAQEEADRIGRPAVISAARGLVALPKERRLKGGPPTLSVYTAPFVRR